MGVEAKGDVGDEDGAGDGGEAATHDLVDFGLRHVRDKRADEHGGFSLADEGRGGCDDGFSARDSEGPEEGVGEFADEPLDEAEVVEKLDEGDEEDDRWDHTGEEPA